MRLYKPDNRIFLNVTVTVVAFVIFAVIFLSGLQQSSKRVNDGSYKATKDAINHAITNCYAIEGKYPQTVDYLIEKYGLIIDMNRYRIEDYIPLGDFYRPTFNLIDITVPDIETIPEAETK